MWSAPLQRILLGAVRRQANIWQASVALPKGVVLNNGIDSEKYRLSDAKRAAVRRALGVEDQIVLGHIGQMYYVKTTAIC